MSEFARVQKESAWIYRIVMFGILLSVIVSLVAVAGPARDDAQAVMDGLKGSSVTAQQGSVTLDAFVDAFPDLIGQLIPKVLVSSCVMVDEEEVCTLTLTPKRAVDLTVDEKAEIFNWQVKRWVLRVANQYRERQKRAELQSDSDAIDAAVAAVVVSDL